MTGLDRAELDISIESLLQSIMDKTWSLHQPKEVFVDGDAAHRPGYETEWVIAVRRPGWLNSGIAPC